MKLKLNKSQWERIGSKAGWGKISQVVVPDQLEGLDDVDLAPSTDNPVNSSRNLQVDIYEDTDKTYMRYSNNSRSAVINDIDSYGAWELLDKPHLIVTVYGLDKMPVKYVGQEAIDYLGF